MAKTGSYLDIICRSSARKRAVLLMVREMHRGIALPGTSPDQAPTCFTHRGRTGKRLISAPTAASATRMSYAACKFSQNCGLLPNQWPRRRAVSAVIDRLPRMICDRRLAGTSICRASSVGVMFSSANSSARTSPGWMGARMAVFAGPVRAFSATTPTAAPRPVARRRGRDRRCRTARRRRRTDPRMPQRGSATRRSRWISPSPTT